MPWNCPEESFPEFGFRVNISLLTVRVGSRNSRLPTPALQLQTGLDDEKVVCPVALFSELKLHLRTH